MVTTSRARSSGWVIDAGGTLLKEAISVLTQPGQTAVALKNARLVDDLRRLNSEITQLNENLTETRTWLDSLSIQPALRSYSV